MGQRVVAVIPARLESSRLPRKMLREAGGRPLICHTVSAVKSCASLDRIVVATDSVEIFKAVEGMAPVCMTGPASNGTERVASIVNGLGADLIINVQGDEPEIKPESLDALIWGFNSIPGCDMATLGTAIQDGDHESMDVVKVVQYGGFAAGFTRHPTATNPKRTLRHVGIYAYTPRFLRWFVSQPPTTRETVDRLEQMRALENDCRIRVVPVDHPYHSIDTAEQFEAFAERSFRLTTLPSDNNRSAAHQHPNVQSAD